VDKGASRADGEAESSGGLKANSQDIELNFSDDDSRSKVLCSASALQSNHGHEQCLYLDVRLKEEGMRGCQLWSVRMPPRLRRFSPQGKCCHQQGG